MSFYLAELAWLTPPEPPERKPIHECLCCEDGICADERYIETSDGYICGLCLDEMTVSDVLEQLNVEVKTAR